jgi:hypothetical protein
MSFGTHLMATILNKSLDSLVSDIFPTTISGKILLSWSEIGRATALSLLCFQKDAMAISSNVSRGPAIPSHFFTIREVKTWAGLEFADVVERQIMVGFAFIGTINVVVVVKEFHLLSHTVTPEGSWRL